MAEAFVNTSFVVAFVNHNDQHHEQAFFLADRLDHSLVTTDAVLLEIGSVLSRNFKPQSVEIIEDFLTADDVQIINLNQTIFNAAFDLYKTHTDKLWGLVDCVSFVVMRQRGITDALSSDKHFVQAGFNALLRA